MDEVWLRLALIGGALVVAGIATSVLRARVSGRKVDIAETGLKPGVYFFSSSACPDCSETRRTLVNELGDEGFVELAWEVEPGEFHRLGVDAVPATMIVGPDGAGRLWPGRPDPALEALGP